jgi:pyruvate kinase
VTESRRTQIIATLGPASRDPAVLRRMVEEGIDWVRLNYAHGGPDEQARAAETVRAVAGAAGRPVRIMADLGGAKVRLGDLGGARTLRVGQLLALGSGWEVPHAIPVTAPLVLARRSEGDMLAVGDGTVELEVVDTGPGWVACQVLTAGQIRSHQGIAVEGAGDGVPCLTPKDHDDLVAALALGVDAVALSMVRRREDVAGLRARLPEGVMALAKLEDAQALADLDGVVATADGVVVARGFLAFTIPPAELALLQKDVLARCARQGRLAVVATDVLASMVDQPRPRRAEIADVVTALLDGADALVLSEETALGGYPTEAVAELRRAAERVEASADYHGVRPRRAPYSPLLGDDPA